MAWHQTPTPTLLALHFQTNPKLNCAQTDMSSYPPRHVITYYPSRNQVMSGGSESGGTTRTYLQPRSAWKQCCVSYRRRRGRRRRSGLWGATRSAGSWTDAASTSWWCSCRSCRDTYTPAACGCPPAEYSKGKASEINSEHDSIYKYEQKRKRSVRVLCHGAFFTDHQWYFYWAIFTFAGIPRKTFSLFSEKTPIVSFPIGS